MGMLARTIRRALPLRWQPPARFMYERMRGLLEREIALVRRTIEPGQRAVDVGANVGIYTYAFSSAGAVVEAFEPQAACARVLEAFAASRRNVRVHHTALGASAGNATLHVPLAQGRVAAGNASVTPSERPAITESVSIRTLDSFELPDVAMIKIDVEGLELDVISGASATVRRSRPLLLVEIERRHRQGPIDQAVDRITGLGYNAFFLDDGLRPRPFSEFIPDLHQPLEGPGAASAPYVNNFLFEPTDGRRRWRW
jgi:FkbM family methyltransferase